jgi:hypothetical protein
MHRQRYRPASDGDKRDCKDPGFFPSCTIPCGDPLDLYAQPGATQCRGEETPPGDAWLLVYWFGFYLCRSKKTRNRS